MFNSFWILLILQFSISLIDAQVLLKDSNYSLRHYSEYNGDIPIVSQDVTLFSQAVEAIDDLICKDQYKLILSDLRNLSTWAVQFYDSSSKFPEGILAGSNYQLGNFDECLEIGGETRKTPHGIHGQYCLGEVHVHAPDSYLSKDGTLWEAFRPATKRHENPVEKLYLGVCVPAACKAKNVQSFIQRIMDITTSGSKLKLSSKVEEKSCYKTEPISVDNIDIIYL